MIELRIHGKQCPMILGAGMQLCVVSHGSEAERLEMFV